jgi:cyclopropane-fatty-acyl-phospholipid synthase
MTSAAHDGVTAGGAVRAGASASSIRAHYDLPASFFQLFLGETMCYSAALFDGATTLDDAQIAKLDHHLDAAGVQPGASVLDIGCGWGALLRRSVDQRSAVRAVGLTLSAAQAEWIRQSAHPRIDVLEQHWADHQPAGSYDAAVSIGAIEHFVHATASEAERLSTYEQFFAKAHSWLKPGGRLSLQCIAHGRDSGRPNILSENGTFPESALPYAWELLRASRGHFELDRLINRREDYVQTLACWTRALRSQAERAAEVGGSEQLASFKAYLSYSAMGFARGSTELLRLVLRPRRLK